MPLHNTTTLTRRQQARTAGALVLVMATLICGHCGCDHPVAKALHPANVAHELRPHRLWRKNQNRPLSENAYFSVTPPAGPSAGDQLGGSSGQQLVGGRGSE